MRASWAISADQNGHILAVRCATAASPARLDFDIDPPCCAHSLCLLTLRTRPPRSSLLFTPLARPHTRFDASSFASLTNASNLHRVSSIMSTAPLETPSKAVATKLESASLVTPVKLQLVDVKADKAAARAEGPAGACVADRDTDRG